MFSKIIYGLGAASLIYALFFFRLGGGQTAFAHLRSIAKSNAAQELHGDLRKTGTSIKAHLRQKIVDLTRAEKGDENTAHNCKAAMAKAAAQVHVPGCPEALGEK